MYQLMNSTGRMPVLLGQVEFTGEWSATAKVALGAVYNGTPSPGYGTGEPVLNLPVGTNTDTVGTNSSQSAYAILQLPQTGQTPSSAAGSNLLYNQADMIIIISNNNTISVTSGAASVSRESPAVDINPPGIYGSC